MANWESRELARFESGLVCWMVELVTLKSESGLVCWIASKMGFGPVINLHGKGNLPCLFWLQAGNKPPQGGKLTVLFLRRKQTPLRYRRGESKRKRKKKREKEKELGELPCIILRNRWCYISACCTKLSCSEG
jgi:hypothetical protein